MAALPPRAAVYTRWRSRVPPASVALISNVLPSLGRMILRRLRDHLEAKAQPPQDWPTPSPIHRSFPGLLRPSLSKAAPASYQARSSVGALYHRTLDSADRGAIILALRKFRVVPVTYSLGHGSLTRSSRLCSLPLKGERRWPGVHAESRKHQPGAVLVSAVGPAEFGAQHDSRTVHSFRFGYSRTPHALRRHGCHASHTTIHPRGRVVRRTLEHFIVVVCPRPPSSCCHRPTATTHLSRHTRASHPHMPPPSSGGMDGSGGCSQRPPPPPRQQRRPGAGLRMENASTVHTRCHAWLAWCATFTQGIQR